MRIKKLFNKICDMWGPWKYMGTVGVYSYYENQITKSRKAYSDFRDVEKDEDLSLNSNGLSGKTDKLGE